MKPIAQMTRLELAAYVSTEFRKRNINVVLPLRLNGQRSLMAVLNSIKRLGKHYAFWHMMQEGKPE